MDFWLAVIFLPFVFAFGASVGSFINVVAYRLPAGLSLIHPPSRCPHCLHPLGRTENVPVLGWLWLRGKCRWCQTAIAPRYPVVEAATGILFSVIFWQFGPTGQTIS
ncbi:MAG: prepilin peptidase, partial [Microcystaceae cyanobacterium]